jgi:hypothetical protein
MGHPQVLHVSHTQCEYEPCSSVVECVKRAAPEDDPLGSKHVTHHMLIKSCCVD